MAAEIEPKMTKNVLPMLIEGILFVADEPVTISELAAVLEVTPRAVRAGLDELTDLLQGRGVRLQRMGDEMQIVSAPEAGVFIERFLGSEGSQRLSAAALEALAVIAYRQPVTRGEIEDIRGVGVSSSIVKTLLEREWIRVLGHREVPGRPAIYGTTKQFLDHFSLKSLESLPPLNQIRDLERIRPDLFINSEALSPQPHEEVQH